MYIEKDKIVIRSSEIKDAEQITKWWNDGKVMSHAGFPKGLGVSKEEVRDIILSNNKDCQLLMVQIQGDDVGEMNYRKTKSGVEIGIKLCKFEYHGKGYGTKLIKLLIDFLCDELHCNLIEVNTNVNNRQAQALYEKVGFKQIRIEKDGWRNQLGELQSTIFYELKK